MALLLLLSVSQKSHNPRNVVVKIGHKQKNWQVHNVAVTIKEADTPLSVHKLVLILMAQV